MRYKIEKKENNVNFIESITGEKFDYIKFADKFYDGEKVEISDYGTLTPDEKKIVDKTVKELNELSNSKKRKKIIAQLDSE